MSQQQISRLEQIIAEYDTNFTGLIVRKDDQIVFEQYYNGCTASSHSHVFSVSKSILSLLLGIAIDKGFLKGIDQSVLDFFPDYKPKRGEHILQKVSIQDMLTMTVPHRGMIPFFHYMRYFMSKDWVKFGLDSLGGRGEIGNFNYVPFAVADVLSGILAKSVRQSVMDFAVQHLFTPLGISVKSNIVLHSAREQMKFNQATDISGWVVDGKGINAGGWGLSLTTADMAKIGQLYLNDGAWNGRQLVSAAWIRAATQEQSRWEQMNLGYGYLCWIVKPEERACAAMGDGGNIIYFNGNKNIVVAISSRFIREAKDRIALIQKYIEPVFCEADGGKAER